MRKILILLGLALAAGSAQAQIKCWTDAAGKRTCGDTPPPGAKVTTLKGPASGPSPAPAAKDGKDGKDAKKGPLTPAEQEAEYRKRRAEADKAGAQAEKDKQAADAKKENCERAKEYLASLGSGRVPRTDAKGERYYMDDKQIEGEKAKASQVVQQSCS